MGVAFAEVSPDFCFCIDTHCYCSAFFAAAGGIRDRYARCLHARCVGVGATERLYFPDSAGLVGRIMRVFTRAYAIYAAGVSP